MDAGPQLAFLLFCAVWDPGLWNGDCCLRGGSSHLCELILDNLTTVLYGDLSLWWC